MECRMPFHASMKDRLPYPSSSPRVCSNSCPLSQWCHLSSVIPSSSCLQFFPVTGSFPMNQLFASGGQCIGASASASVLPMNIQHWFPLGLTGLTSLLSKGLARVFSSTTVQLHQFFGPQPFFFFFFFFLVQLSRLYMTTGKTIASTVWTIAGKVMALIFNMLSRCVIAFLPRSVF